MNARGCPLCSYLPVYRLGHFVPLQDWGTLSHCKDERGCYLESVCSS